MRPLICALDLGSSGAKAALVDVNGDVLAQAYAPIDTILPDYLDWYSAHDPDQWLAAARTVLTEIAPPDDEQLRSRIAGLGVTGQMKSMTVVPGSTPSDPAHPHATDNAYFDFGYRDHEEADEIHEKVPTWEESTGNIQGPSSTAARWASLDAMGMIMYPRDMRILFGSAGYLAWALGLGAWCDQTTATATGFAHRSGTMWLPEVAEAARIWRYRDTLPALFGEGVAALGRLSATAADLIGMPAGVPFVLAPGNTAAVTLGMVGAAHDSPYAFLDESAWVGAEHPTTLAAPDPDRFTLAIADGVGTGTTPGSLARPGGSATLDTVPFASGHAIAAWGRTVLLGGATREEADARVARWIAEHGLRITHLPTLPATRAYPVMEHYRAKTRALMAFGPDTDGLTLYRALLEGVAFDLSRALDTLASQIPNPLPLAGEGAASRPWRQIISEVLKLPVSYVEGVDPALLGTALATAHALGLPHRIRPLAQRPDADVVTPDENTYSHDDEAKEHVDLREAIWALNSCRL